MKNFAMNNPAREFRDKIITLYDEFICTKINADLTYIERD